MPVTRSAPGTEADADIEDVPGSAAKRRKTRKGTRSCWACKRRKEKCVFDQSSIPAHDAAVCQGCQRRGTRCVSQDSPDDLTSPPDGSRQMADRLVRVENLVQNLLHQMGDDDDVPTTSAHRIGGGAILTPASTESGHPSSSTTIPNTPTPTPIGLDRPMAASSAPHDRWQRKVGHPTSSLSYSLYSALPTPKDNNIIIQASYRSFYMFNKALTVSYKNLSRQTGPNWVHITRPDAQDHHILIARYMLQLAHLLQQLHLKFDDPAFEDLKGLSEPPQALMERLSETAVSQVSTQERLVFGSIEGLECIMLESTFYANDGRLRLSWSSCRRALHLAQLMGLQNEATKQQSRHQFLDPMSVAEPSALWVRIIHRDRSLSLLLGLPPGSTDKTVVSDDLLAQDTPLGRLERFHCDIMLSLLERKEKARSRDLALAHSLDKELQQAARVLPSKWWLTPSFPTPEKHDESTFWGIKRLVLQMSHYNILNQIHLPFMLRASSDTAYEYSKTACVNASREILGRFIVLQHLNEIAFCCRTPDFLALMAAMTLILAHLQNHARRTDHTNTNNPMAHQYLSDRGMIEQTQESMEEFSRVSGESLSAESASLLRRLLVIEAEAADGCRERAQGVDVLQPQSEEGNDGDGIVRVTVPYFGVVRIAREGIISRETPEQQPAGTRPVWQEGRLATTYMTVTPPIAEVLPVVPLSPSTRRVGQPSDTMFTEPPPLDTMEYPMQANSKFPNSVGQWAVGDDWGFQGIDMAFFDNLLSGDAGDDMFH
ncbi:hypothetical protein PG984_011898 [Apiospora sp. TS-2023a]